MQKLKLHFWLILSLLVATFAGRMLLTSQHFYTHDDIQVLRVNEYIECFRHGQIPCRWSYNLGKGYGMPWFNYYPPMIYAIPSIIQLFGFSIITSLNLFMFMTFILAAWSMYRLVKYLAKREDLAFLGSALYTLYPFHATNVFIRGVYAENLAWSFAPLIFYFLARQLNTKREPIIPILFATLFLTHIISSFILTLLCFAWLLVLSTQLKQNFLVNSLKFGKQVLIGLSISAFFFIPAITEKNLVQSETLTQGYFSYVNHYVSFFQLFKEYKWNYEASLWNEAWDEMGFMVGHIHTAALVILSILAAIKLLIHKKYRYRSTLFLGFALIIIAGLILFMAHFKSDFIWSLIPSLAYIQFPWRFIGWAGLPLTLAICTLIYSLPTKLIRPTVLATACVALIYSTPFFRPKNYDTYRDQDYLRGGQFYEEQQSKSFFDYLPKTVKNVPELNASLSKEKYPIFYFPGWVAKTQVGAVELSPDPLNGLIQVNVPTSQEVKLKWIETPTRLIWDIISLISIIWYCYLIRRSHVQ